MHVAVTRAEELLVLSGTFRSTRGWGTPGHRRPALAWMGPGLLGADAFPPLEGPVTVGGAHVHVALNAPGGVLDLGAAAQPPQPAGTAAVLEGTGDVTPAPEPASAPAPATLSYSSLSAHRRCGYSWYLRRVLGLPERDPAAGAGGRTGDDARRRGSIAHAVLERAVLTAGAPPPGPADVRAAAAAIGEPLDDAEIDDQLRLAGVFLDGHWRARAAAALELRREVPFALPLDDGGADGPLLNGVIDLLAVEAGDRMLVVDHKTDRVAADADVEALVARDYAIQRAIYALAALRAGAAAVDVVHLYLEHGAAACVSYTAADAPALAAAVREAAAALLAGTHPVAEQPYAGLCARCPGRGGLCPQPSELTDRPAPTAA